MTGPGARRWDFLASLLLGFLAVAGHDAGGVTSDLSPTRSSAVRISGGPGALTDTLLPNRPHLETGSWLERSPQKTRPYLALAVLLAVVAPLALLSEGVPRGPSGQPSRRRRGHGSPLRGPPLLPTT
ncbi:MAG: hypothetical protein ABR540_10865 [Acidimicrobiales bacterium]